MDGALGTFWFIWIDSLNLEVLVVSYLDLARGRYSCREFEDRAVEQAVVDAIVEAGRIAPSACNNHPTRLLLVSLGLLVMGLSLALRLSS